jgi:hypothetical protein
MGPVVSWHRLLGFVPHDGGRERAMAKKKEKKKRVILMPKGRGKIPLADIIRAVETVTALREQREKERAASDGKK